MHIGIEVLMRGHSCENNAYAIVYGMRVNLDPIRNTCNNVQEGSREGFDLERDRPAVQGARLTLSLSVCGIFVRRGLCTVLSRRPSRRPGTQRADPIQGTDTLEKVNNSEAF